MIIIVEVFKKSTITTQTIQRDSLQTASLLLTISTKTSDNNQVFEGYPDLFKLLQCRFINKE